MCKAMKFYEFDKRYDYYALIGADTEQKAIELYQEVVADIDDEDAIPKEKTMKETLKAVIDVYKDGEEINGIIEFAKNMKSGEPFIVLVDGTLI